MKISGLQKLTLLDFPGKIACTVFTSGCNFRCPFCHNASLVNGDCTDTITEEEFFGFLEKRRGILEGVCITGGEPTLQKDLKDFIAKIKEKGFLVKLDTNGYRPDILIDLIENNLLDYVAMDIKNAKEKYGLSVGIHDFDITPVIKSAEYLTESDVDYEFRTTVVKELHSSQDIADIAKWIKNAKRFFLQGFVDSGDILNGSFNGYDEKEMKNLLKLTLDYIKDAEIRGF